MKRLLVFALIFGAGLGLLLWLQGHQDSGAKRQPFAEVEPGENELDPELVPVLEPVPEPELDQGIKDAPEEAPAVAGRVGLKGRFKGLGYPKEGGEALFVLIAEDASTAAGGWLNLTDLVLTYPGLGVLVAERGRIVFDASGAGFTSGQLGGQVELENGVLTLEEGHALAPATFTSPTIVGDLDQRVFDLTGGPVLESWALRVRGQKIHLEPDNNLVVVHGAALAEVLGETGATERTLAGQLLRLEETSPEQLHLQAEGEAVLTLAARGPSQPAVELRAPQIDLDARRTIQAGQKDQLELVGVQVSGGRAVLTSGEATITGDSFVFAFDESGQAREVTVSGQPVVSFPAELAKGGSLDSLALAPDERIEISSAGTIRLTLDRHAEILTTGASRLSLGSLSLEAGAGFEGYRQDDKRLLHLTGRGGVTLHGNLPPRPDGVVQTILYEADELVVDHSTAPGRSQTRLASKGNTQLNLRGGGESAEFTSTKALELQLREVDSLTSWSIPYAEELVFELVSNGLRTSGSAARIENFEPDGFRFDGQQVVFDRVPLDGADANDPRRVSARGMSLHANGENDLSITGSASELAEFGNAGLLLRAESLQRQGSTFTAQGRVHAEVGNEAQRSSFNCERLTVEGLELDPSGQQPPTAKRLLAEQAVRASATLGGQKLGLMAEVVELVNLGSENLELHASKQVRLSMQESDADWSVSSERLDALSRGSETNPPADNANWLEVVAKGSVVVHEKGSGFDGRGETLFIDRGPSSRVLLEGGEQAAWVSSTLPSGAVYTGRVARLLLSEKVLRAEQLTGVIDGVFLPGSSQGNGSSKLELQCELFSAFVERLPGEVRDVVQLDGNVRIKRRRQDGPKDSLRAQHVTFSRLRSTEAPRPQVFDPQQTAFLAHGQVVLRSGVQFQAYGEHLEIAAGASELHFEGTPAAVLYAGFCSMSTWITIDPNTMLVESGKGNVCQDPALFKRLVSEEQDE